jgi:septal ring factor EnvC (AmiA/AmiB activator)
MRLYITLFSLLFCILGSFAQHNSKLKDLESKRKATLEQIAGITKQLSVTKKSAAHSLHKLDLLAKQIASRRHLIELLNAELDELEAQITTLEAEITQLEKELNLKKGEYSKSVQLMFMKRSSYEKLMFIFSSNTLTQAYRRSRYLKEYAVWSRLKGEELMDQQVILNRKKDELQKSKADKESLLIMREVESKNLQKEENNQKVVVVTLKKKQGELQTTLAKQKKQAAALDQQIQRIIQEEIRKAQEEARRAQEAEARRAREEEARRQRIADEESRRRAAEAAAAKHTTTKPTSKQKPEVVIPERKEKPKPSEPAPKERKADVQGGYAMTKEEKTLSDDFSKNRGILPLPVTGRIMVIGHYGQQQHGDLKYVVTNNNGVDIQADQGADARAVFKGVVSKVFAVPGYNSSIIVRHGNYLSVYSNLSRVYVSAGDHVSTKQSIGKIYSDADDGNQTVLHFQIWKETSKQNPESWINF